MSAQLKENIMTNIFKIKHNKTGTDFDTALLFETSDDTHSKSGVDLEEIADFDIQTGLSARETVDLPSHSEPEVIRHLIIKKRVKTEEEIKREEKIAAGVRKSKEEELAEIEENEKVVIKKKLEAPVKEVKIEKADKADSKKTLEDLDKKLDEILTDDIL